MYVCICKGIRECDLRELGQAGITCPKTIARTLGIDDKENCCGRCIKKVGQFVKIAVKAPARHSLPIAS